MELSDDIEKYLLKKLFIKNYKRMCFLQTSIMPRVYYGSHIHTVISRINL